VHDQGALLAMIAAGQDVDRPTLAEVSVMTLAVAEKAPPVKTAVKLGVSDGLNVEVSEGLSMGAKVLERPPKKLTSAVD